VNTQINKDRPGNGQGYFSCLKVYGAQLELKRVWLYIILLGN